MSGQPVCRIGDLSKGVCNAHLNPVPFVAYFATGSNTVDADGIPVVRIGDIGFTDCGHTVRALTASEVSTADGIPIHRIGDTVVVLEGGQGISITGSPTTTSD